MLKYIHLFETEQEFIENYNEFDTYLEPWLSYTEETDSVSFNNPDPPKPYDERYLTIKAVTNGNITWKCRGVPYSPYEEYIIKSMDPPKTVYYSKNDGEWVEITTSGSVNIAVTVGDKIRFKGNNATYQGNGTYAYEWDPEYEESFTFNYGFGASTATFEVGGNIMSLLYGDNFLGQTTLQSAYTFSYLFYYCTGLTLAQNLVLPATTLANYCYRYMFIYCSSLTTAPELPATTLTTNCYNGMFSNCSKLNYIKCLATDISASDCTYYWVTGVSSTGTFVKDASMSNWTTGNNGIPSGWTVQDAS